VKKISKDPGSTLNYSVDWAPSEDCEEEGPWLDEGDTIAASTWSATPAGLDEDDEDHTDTVATVLYSGGVLGTVYEVRNRITTAAGLIEFKTFQIAIEEH
jgi:hypothetical protein